MDGYSDKCLDRKTRWDRVGKKCVLCHFKPGYEITPNCGFDDRGGQHVVPIIQCRAGTFNDGSRAYCQACTTCPPGFEAVTPCSLTSDTQCRDVRTPTTTVSVNENSSPPSSVPASTIQTNQGSTLDAITIQTTVLLHPAGSHVLWAAPLAIVIFIMLVFLSACVYMKRKKGQRTVLCYNRRSSFINAGFSSLPASSGNNDLEDVLSSNNGVHGHCVSSLNIKHDSAILSAPLQTVLDNLDVLEELVILLDPESHGVKNTKHLASHCSFPSTWITYTYSMRDSKSPLKAVLEGISSRHPDWTVGHLAKLLRQMERNDAISVLAKLGQNEMVL